MDFALLKTIAEAHGADTAAYLLEPVNVDAGPLGRRAIKIVLLGRGRLDAVAAAVPIFFNDPDFSTIRISDPLTQAVLAQLKAGNVLSDADVAALNEISVVPVPRWQSLGFITEPQQGDINWALAHF